MNTPGNKTLTLARKFGPLAFILVVAILAAKPINGWLGHRAVEKTGLEYLPYEQVLRLSEETGKPVMLEFAAIWCGTCRRLDNQVFGNEQVREKIQSDYLFSRLDWDQDQAIFDRYGIQGFPTVLIIEPESQSARRVITTFDPVEFLTEIERM